MTSQGQLIRRKYPRVVFSKSMGLLIDGHYQLVRAHEIGEGGVSFFYFEKIELAKRLILTIPMGSGQFICVYCEVRNQTKPHADQFSMGVQFLDISFEHKRSIRNLVSNFNAVLM